MKIILTFCLLILASATWAGDQAVNCRTEVVGQQNLYTGWANCNVNINGYNYSFINMS